MAQVVVYGASDDLLEVDGDLRQEFLFPAEGIGVLIFDDGTQLQWTYSEEGLWKASIAALGPTTTISLEEAVDPESDDYSDHVRLSGPLSAVTFTTL